MGKSSKKAAAVATAAAAVPKGKKREADDEPEKAVNAKKRKLAPPTKAVLLSKQDAKKAKNQLPPKKAESSSSGSEEEVNKVHGKKAPATKIAKQESSDDDGSEETSESDEEPAKEPAAKPLTAIAKNGSKTGKQKRSSHEDSSEDESDDNDDEPAKKAAAKPLGAVAKNGLKNGNQESTSNEGSSYDDLDDDVEDDEDEMLHYLWICQQMDNEYAIVGAILIMYYYHFDTYMNKSEYGVPTEYREATFPIHADDDSQDTDVDADGFLNSPMSTISHKRASNTSDTAPMFNMMKGLIDILQFNAAAWRETIVEMTKVKAEEKQVEKQQVKEEIEKCLRLAVDCGATEESEEYWVATKLLEEKYCRIVFSNFRTNEGWIG